MKLGNEARADYPPSSTAFEWLMGLLALALVGGLTLNFWAQEHGVVGQNFLSPWHAVLHASIALNAVVLGVAAARNMSLRHYSVWRSLPAGYGLSLIGVVVFVFDGLLNLFEHARAGAEGNVQDLLAPTHLIFAIAAALVITGPIRSAVARIRPSIQPSWVTHGPLVVSLAATIALLGFFTQFAHPLYVSFGAKDKRPPILGAIYFTKIDGSHQMRLLFDPAHDVWSAAVSPDGKRVAYRRENLGLETSDIFVAKIDGSNATRITHSGRHDTQPAWSPDGREIAYISAPLTSGDFMLRVVAASGGQPRTLASGAAVLSGASWSPDGNSIVFGSQRGKRDWVAAVAPGGGAVRWLVAGADGSWPAWRPDGNAIAFVHDQKSDPAIYVLDGAGATSHQVSRPGEDARSPSWSPDGRKIAFTSWRDKTLQVYLMNADGSGDEAASRNPGLFADRPAWASDDEIIFGASQQRAYDPSQDQSLAVGSLLLQTIILMGGILFLVRRWRMPLGALTVIVTLSGLAMIVTSGQFFVLPWIVAAGVIGDAIVALAGARSADAAPFYAFAFVFSAAYAALYEAAVALSFGRGWPVNLAISIPITCGIAGLLLAYVLRMLSSTPHNEIVVDAG